MAGELTLEYQKEAIPNRGLLLGQSLFSRDWPLTKSTYIGSVLKFFGYLGLSFLLARFTIPGGVNPAGAALLLANNRQKIHIQLALLAGVIGGTFSTRQVTEAMMITVSLLIWYLITGFFNKRRTSPKPSASFTVWAVLRIAATAMLGPVFYQYLISFIELIITYILTKIFNHSLSFLENPVKSYSKLSLATLALVAILGAGGIGDIIIQGINFRDLIVVLFLMIVSYLGGGGVGAVMGISIAIVVGITVGGMVPLVALYGISGLLGGIFRDLGRWGTAAGTSLGWFFALQQLHFEVAGGPQQLLPWGMGMAAFILVPRRYLSQISNYFPNPDSSTYSQDERKKLREIVMTRLDDLAAIFTELACSFNNNEASVATNQRVDLYSLLDRVCSKNCQHCTGYDVCWGENFYSTYREIFDLLALAELYGEVNIGHLKGKLAKTCFQQFKLMTTINHLFEKCQNEYQWQRKLEEGKYFLANQLQGMADIICNLAREISTDTSFRSEVEEHLKHGFNRVGMNVRDVAVTSIGEERLEIKVRQRSCHHKHECGYLVAPMIGRLLGTEYTVWERQCQLENGNCSYCLSPVRKYAVKTNVCKLAKHGNESSGDSNSLHELKDGHFVAILSDGMGNGNKASLESQTTVSILEKLLESGIDRDFAVKMVNSVLLLRSPEESFATVDLVLIDLFDGKAEFIKIGAASTYIKRGREVIGIQSTSLPAGILNTVDFERTEMHLQPGDMVIMATDGVIDSKVNPADKEEWVVRALRQVEVVGPEALGEYLMSLARINQDGVPKDDMTVIVLQFCENGAEGVMA